MKKSLLIYLHCLFCKGNLQLAKHCDELEIISGSLNCSNCNKHYKIINGVPDFIDNFLNNNHKVKLTAENFGYSWQKFSRTSKDFYRNQFFDWISPINNDFLNGKFVLDAGCGKGHHLMMISPYVKEAIGVDISNSAFIAYNNTKHLSNIHIIKADLNNLPIKDEIFDYAYSVGVVHHTESPKLTTSNLYKKLKKSGSISLWIYGKENNEWIICFINPIRKFLTNHMPLKIIHIISFLLALFLFPILKLIYLPINKFNVFKPIRKILFYYPYLSYISKFDLVEINNIIFDHLVAPISHYLSKKEIEDMVNIDSSKPNIERHNQNSWRILISKNPINHLRN